MAYSSDKFKKALEQKVPKQQTSAIKADSPYDQSKFYSAFRRAVKNNPNVSVAAKNPYQAQNSRQSYLDYVERRVGSTTDTTAQTYGSTLSGYDPKKYAGVQTEYDRLTAQKQSITELKQKKKQLEDIFNAYGEIPFSDGNGKFHYRPEVQKVYDQIADINRQIQQAQKDWDDSGAAADLKKLETENKNYLAVAAKEYGTEGVKSRAAAYDTAKMSAAELKQRQQQLQDIILDSGEAALPDSDGNMRYSADVQKRYEELQAVQRQLQQAEQQRDLAGVDLSLAVRSERNRKYYDLSSEAWFNKAAYMGQKTEVPEYEKAASGVENKLGFYEQYKDDAPVETFTDNIGNTHTVKNAGAQLIDEGNRKHWDLLNEDERNVYFALLDHDGSQAANQFLDDIQVSLDQRAYDQRSEETQQEVHEAGTGKKIGMNAVSVGANVLGQVPAAISDAVSMTESAITEGEFNPYTNAHAWQQYAQDVRTATGEDIYNSIADSEGYQAATAELEKLKQLREQELARTGGTESSYDARIEAAEKQLSGMKAQNAWGEIVSNGYQAVMSGLDSAFGATLMGKYYTLAMGAGAASQRARELYEAGASRDQIAAGAVASGAVEALFEYVSLDKFAKNFLNSPISGKMDFVKKLLVQGGIEATEEINTELANMIVDAWNRGWTSDNNNAIRDYMEKDGLSYAEAERKAAADAAMNVFWAAYGGFISGGAMGAVGGIENKIRYNQYLQRAGENIVGSGNLSDLLENAGTVQDDSGKVAQLRQTLEGTDTTTQSSRELKKTNRQVGELYDRVQQSNMDAAIRTETQLVQELAEEELAKQGVENPQAAAEAVAKSYAGKPMSTNEKTLFDRVNGQQILDTVTSGESFSSEVERRLEPIAQQYRRNYESTVYSKAEAQEARAAVGELEENRNYDPDAMRQVYRAGQNPELFSSAYRAAYDFGRFGGTQEQAFAAKSTHYLTQEQRQAAYAAGTEARKEVARSFYRSAGRQNKGVDNIPMQLARALTLEERQQAYAAGMAEADTKEGTNYGTENRVRQSTQRADSANPGGEARGVAESTAVGQVRSQEGGSRSAENSGKVSAAQLGIPGGSTSQNVSILTPEQYGNSERAAEQVAADRGLKLVVFSGDALEITEAGEGGTTHSFRARGTIVGDTIYARADDPDFTTAQITRHEAAHRDIAEGKLDMEAARQRIRELFDDNELSYLARIYADAYGDALTDAQVWEEIVCDSIAEMNVFADEKSLSDYVDVLLGEVAEGAKKPGQNSNTKNGDARYSIIPTAKDDVHRAVTDLNYREDVMLTDGSPSIMLEQKGVKNLPMTMKSSHIRENILTEQEALQMGLKDNKNVNYHGLGEESFLKVIEDLDNITRAYRGTKNAQNPTRREDYFLLISKQLDHNGNQINVPIYINKKGQVNQVMIDTNKIATVFGKEGLEDYIKRELQNGNIVRIKKRSTQVGERTVPITAGYGSNASINSISQPERDVKGNFSRELNRDVSRLQTENRELRRKLEKARKQTKLSSPVVSARDEDVNRYTRRLLKEYGSNVDFQEAAKLVKQIAETVLRNPDGYTNQAAYGSILRNAEKLAEQIVGGFNTVFTEQDRQDAVQFTRNDILDDIFSGKIRKEPSTYADRQNAKYQKLQRNLESIHRDYAERDRRMADRRSRTEKIQSIRKLGDQFKRMISAPAKGATQHAPVTLLSAAAVLCNVLTEEQNARLNRSEQYLERRAEALANADIRGSEDLKAARYERADIERREQRITRTREALAKLSKIYANLQGGVDGKFFDPHVAELLKTVADTLEGKTLYDLNAGELDDVSCAMRALHYTIKNANQVFAMGQQKTLNEVSQRWYRQIQNTTAAKNQAAVAARRYFMWQLSPENFFSYTCGWAKNNEGIAVSNMFKNGTERYLRVQKEFYELFRPFTESTDKDVQKAMKRLLQNQTKELVTIPGLTTENGKDIKVSRSMAMMLHMLISQQHSRQAIVMGGLKIPKLDVYYKGKIVDSYGDADLGDLLSNSVGRGYVENVRDIQELQKELDGLRELEMLEGMERQISEVRVTSQQNPNPELLEQKQERSYGDRAVEIENQIRTLEHQAKTIAESGEIKLLEIQRELEDMFTDTEKDLIRTAAEWFRHTGDLMREVYQDMYGYSPLLVENYVPVHRDTTTVVIDIRTENGQIFNLENSPFTIHRVKSSSPILLTDLFSELASQMERSARYYGFAQAQRDFNRIWNNYVGTGQTVNGAIESRFGSGTTTLGVSGTMYVENFLKSVAGTNKSNDILSKFYGNAAAATLTLNGRVAMSQLASIPTAAGVVGWKNMAKGFVKGLPTAFSTEKKRQLANDSLWFYSRYKGAGGITEVADLRQKGGFWKRIADSPVGKHLFNWCQAMDVFATSTMWSMAEEAVQQRGMKPNTEGYSDAVAAQYAEIIRKTQPNYTETERSDLLRDKRGGVKFLTMYKTQSNQNLNLLLSSAGELTKAMRDYKAGTNGVTAMDVKNAKVNMVNAATSVIIGGSLAFVLLRTAMNFLLRKVNPYRDKETDEVTMEGVLKGAKKEFASSMFGMVALGGDVFDFVYSAISKDTYYGISDSAIGLISDAGNTGQKLLSTLHSAIEEGNYEKVPEELKKFLMDFCKVFGVPASNAESLYNAAMEWLHELQSGTLGQYLPEDPSYKQLNAQILRAYEAGDSEKISNVLAMMAAKTEADTDQEAQKEVLSEVKSYLKKRYLDGGVNIDTVQGVLGEYLDVSQSDLNNLEYIWNFTAENPEYAGTGKLSDTAIMKYKDLEKANITVAQWYEIYKTCSGFEGDKDKDGKTISGTKKKKIVNYIHSLNLSNAQKNAVWKAVAASNNYSDKTLPPKM